MCLEFSKDHDSIDAVKEAVARDSGAAGVGGGVGGGSSSGGNTGSGGERQSKRARRIKMDTGIMNVSRSNFTFKQISYLSVKTAILW